jgi:hypothetical protein
MGELYRIAGEQAVGRGVRTDVYVDLAAPHRHPE